MFGNPSFWSPSDRRRRRSANASTAVQFQLEYTQLHGAFEAVAVVDQNGLLIAHAGDAAVCTELAAYVPMLVASPLGTAMPPLLRGAQVAIESIDTMLYFVTIGRTDDLETLLHTSIDGVRRILGLN